MKPLDNDELLGFSEMNGEAEVIPVLSTEDEEEIENEEIPETLPILPLRNAVLFPGVITPITVGREKSLKLIKEVNKGNKTLGAIAQKSDNIEEPGANDFYPIGTVARIIKMLNMPEGNTTILIQGRRRFKMHQMVQEEPYLIAQVESMPGATGPSDEEKFDALLSSMKDMAYQIIKKSPNIPSESSFTLDNIESSNYLVNYICSNLNTDVQEKQKLLEIDNIQDRTEQALESLSKEMQMVDLKNDIQSKVKSDLDKQQRDYFLNQQLKTIKEELGDNTNENEIEELREKAKQKKWPERVGNIFEKEVSKLQRMNPAAMEYSIQMNYLDTLVDLPWNEYSKDYFDLENAQNILDRDHYGLEKVKDRIIEYLAVLKLKGDMKSPILCFVGPPGVGKTSLGKSIAEALGRKYIRMSLGGLRDEAEIRGHRKTYIGAMPGRVIQSIRKTGTANPVFVLDEVDKVAGANVNGDPASALLEVLDPEQNTEFYDNFLETEFDLSHVMFIATANTLNTIHPALRDRMEVIYVNGYLMEEKAEIAKRHLIPKQLKEQGVKSNQISFKKAVLEKIIEDYTRESGVRNLEKRLAKVIRNQARHIVTKKDYRKSIQTQDLHEILGPPQFHRDEQLDNDVPGVVTGLAWTAVGGEIMFVEVSLSSGRGKLTLTGNLGEVMKESATIAFEYLKSNSNYLQIKPAEFEKWNVHIHIPEGATPKDGPSAGITIFTALASAFTRRKVKTKVAMTGEITLRGRVLPVGGIKEKILAAKRSKIKDIIISEENRKDIEDIKPEYIKGLRFHYIRDMIEVIDFALLKEKAKKPAEVSVTRN
ncbi:MAG: endopeptidase La [Bacteroidales bacterium]|nr:endopeptidase La [Bacteroidales bacterium]MCF8333693.1 endopeptidase La [Bacteroidales bacterium]